MPFLSRSPSHCTCTVLLHLVIANTQMNGDQKIIELLTKISNTLEEIKAQNAMAQPAVARAPSKLPPPPTAPAPAKRRCIQHSQSSNRSQACDYCRGEAEACRDEAVFRLLHRVRYQVRGSRCQVQQRAGRAVHSSRRNRHLGSSIG